MYNSPKILLKGIKAKFFNMLQTVPDSTFDFAIQRETSNSNLENYWVPESLPAIKEWITNITYEDMGDEYLQVANKDWQDGIIVDRYTLKDSSIEANVNSWLKTMTNLYSDFQDELCQIILDNNTTCFDGTALFAGARSNLDTGSNTIDNLYPGTLSGAYTTSTFSADFEGAKNDLLGFRDKHNRAFNKKAKLVAFVPQHLESIASKVLGDYQTYIDAATSVQVTNIYANQAKIIINWEQGSSNNDWYLINESALVKPFLIQDREKVKWSMKDDEEYKYIKYWFTFRMGYSPLNPMSIIKINN